MAFDALAIHRLIEELEPLLVGGRIDKVYQPENDEILLGIRTFEHSYKLTVSAASGNPRVHLTEKQKSNPKTPPMFCMLMRKHIGSGKIVGIRQVDFERVIIFDIESYDELGDLSVKHLIAEIMGRHSNIILTNKDMKIIDCVKHVDFTVSSVRSVLPGLIYTAPPAQNKIPFIEASSPAELYSPQRGARLSQMLMDVYCGISPIIAREMVYDAYGRCDLTVAETADFEPLYNVVMNYVDKIKRGDTSPCIVTDSTGKMIDFSVFPIKQYEGMATVEYFESVNKTVERFYQERDSRERMKQKSADLLKLLNTHLERAEKKRTVLMRTMQDAHNKEEYKIRADLLMANSYRIESGMKSIELENYYDPSFAKIKITLDPSMNGVKNAERYYKKYNKAKTAEVEVAKQLSENKADIDYLESTLSALENAENAEDLSAIKAELAKEGYIKRRAVSGKKQPKSKQFAPMHFVSADGFDIYVGRNNTQNDYLTLKFANSGDMWFHTKNIHGSHVIIKLGIDKDIPRRTIVEAAELAAYYSKARSSAQVPVDYTRVKNVKKPNGAKPGMVIYDGYNTIYVKPDKPEEMQ